MAEGIKLTDRASVERVLKEMTLDEKLYMLTGGSGFGTCAVPRLGIPAAMMVDSAAGVNLAQYFGDLYSRYQIREGLPFKSLAGVTNTEEMGAILTAISEGRELKGEMALTYQKIQKEQHQIAGTAQLPTCFPTGMLMGSTWNPEVIEACGRALGREADSLGVNVLLGSPDVNIQRDPRGGRVFECYTEDPCLMSELTPAMVRGVQSQGIFANAKHFAANNQETARLNIDENISERALREVYLPGFRACVEKGGLKSVMCAYNRINGVGCSMNRWLIHDVLRGEWKFDGVVMSDWGGVYDQVEAVRAGNDLDMPGVRDMEPVRKALESGELTMEEVDFCVRNILNFLVDNPSFRRKQRPEMDRAAACECAYQAALEGFVLLKNDGVLPLRAPGRVALFGEGSRQFLITSRQSSRVFTYKYPRLMEELANRLGAENVSFDCIEAGTDCVILTLQSEGTEGRDRPDLCVDAQQHEALMRGFLEARHRKIPCVLLLNIAAPLDITAYLEWADAIVAVYYPGVEGARALADILLGRAVPSGHLSMTYPRRIEDLPAYGFFPGSNYQALYNEDIFVGYRYYDLKKIEPLFPFGYGLSYTSFEMCNLRLSVDCLNQDVQQDFTVWVDVKNTGDWDAKATVQIYLSHASVTLPRPVRELKAFQKVFLKRGESKTLAFQMHVDQIKAYDPRFAQWVAERGVYTFEAGWDSRNLPLAVQMRVSGHTIYDFGTHTPIHTIMDCEAAYRVLLSHFEPFGVQHGDFADCLKYFPDKELGNVIRELIVNKQLSADTPGLRHAIESVYRALEEIQSNAY